MWSGEEKDHSTCVEIEYDDERLRYSFGVGLVHPLKQEYKFLGDLDTHGDTVSDQCPSHY